MRKSIVDYCIISVTLPRLLLFPLGALLLAFPLWPVILHTLLAQSLRFSFRTWRLFTYGFVPTLQAMSFSIGFFSVSVWPVAMLLNATLLSLPSAVPL